MKLLGFDGSFRKRMSPIHLFFIFFSPIILSLIIHFTLLYFSDRVRWQFNQDNIFETPKTAKVLLDGKADNRLQFQGTDHLDSFKTEDTMVYPAPEVEYRPIAPDVEFMPEAKVNDAIDLISVPAAAINNDWVNPSTGRQPLYTGSEKLVGSFSRHIQVLREGGLDVVFVFDATHSMARYIKEVKHKIANLAKTYKKLVPTSRIGMVAYRDYKETFVTKSHPLTYGIGSLQYFLNQIKAEGGGDREEAVEEALRVAVETMNWNKKSKKIILLIGDAPPRPENMAAAVAYIDKFRKIMDGRLAVLDTRIPEYEFYAPTPKHEDGAVSETETLYSKKDLEVMDEFKIFAEKGGGEGARLADEERVVKQMLVLVFGGRWEMYLDEFMKNL